MLRMQAMALSPAVSVLHQAGKKHNCRWHVNLSVLSHEVCSNSDIFEGGFSHCAVKDFSDT
jgi:hypothetical protein